MARYKLIHLIWIPLLVYLVYFLEKLVCFDNLSSIANDSVNYLVMARHYSPWVSETEAIGSAWLIQDFPPLFPWVLALSGTAHSLLYGHLLVAGIGLASLYPLFLVSNRWLKNQWWAVLPLLVFALSPGYLLGLQGILSESTYLMLVLVFLLVYRPSMNKSAIRVAMAGLLLAAILLTRTVGFALLLAVLAQAFFSSISLKRIQSQSFIVVVISVGVFLLLMAFLGPGKESHYADILVQFMSGHDVGSLNAGSTVYVSQITSLLDSWRAFWLIYWVDEFSPSHIVIMLLLLASLSGLLTRLLENKYDAWYVLFYVLILLVWPHPGQMVRLLFPIMPILLVYAGYGLARMVEHQLNYKNKELLPAVFFILVIAAILPSHTFMHARAEMASQEKVVPVYEMFRRPDMNVAAKELVIQNQMLKGFVTIKDFVSSDEKVMYFMPSYLAVLSDRQGVKTPYPVDNINYRRIAKESGAGYIFLTRFHPRKTRKGYSGFSGEEHLDGWTEVLWCSDLYDGNHAACLYRVAHPLAEPE